MAGYKSYSYRLFTKFVKTLTRAERSSLKKLEGKTLLNPTVLSVNAAEPRSRDVEKGNVEPEQNDVKLDADDTHSGHPTPPKEPEIAKDFRFEVDALNNLGPPNLQLNHARPYDGDRFWMLVKLFSAAVLSVIIQCGLIAIAAATAYHASTRQAVGYDFIAYGFPCFCAGSLLLCAGMILCSVAIEQSTVEYCWIRTKEKTQEDNGARLSSEDASKSDPRLLWIQKGQSVNDQVFDPYIILEGARETIVTSSRWKDHAVGGGGAGIPTEEEGGAEKSILGSGVQSDGDAEQTPDKNASPSVTSAAPLSKKKFVTWWRTSRKWLGKQLWQSLTLLGVLLSGSGFVCQFIGLRALPFPLAFAQLGGVVIMAVIRAAVRSELGYSFRSCEPLPGYELEYLAIQITFNSTFRTLKSPLDAEGRALALTRKDAFSRYCWRVITAAQSEEVSEGGEGHATTPKGSNRMTRPPGDGKLYFQTIEDLISDDIKATTPNLETPTVGTSSPKMEGLLRNTAPTGAGRSPGDSAHDTSWSHQLLRVHWRLRYICNWDSVGSTAAAALCQSMKFVLDEFFPSDATRPGNGINIAIPAAHSPQLYAKGSDCAHGTAAQDYVVVRCWVKDGKWAVEEGILESLISLWMSYVEAKDLEEPGRFPAVEGSGLEQMRKKYPYRRILGDDDEYKALRRDLYWWIDGFHQLLHAGASQTADQARVVIGFNGARKDRHGGDKPNPGVVDSSPAEGKRADEISIEATQALPLVLAQHIFTCFMWSIVGSLGRECWQRGASSSQRQVQIAWADGLDWGEFETTWSVPTLQHRLLTTVVGQIERTGLGDKTEILLCIIPPLSRADVLPNEAYLRLLPSPSPNQGWAELARFHGQLLEKLNVVTRPREEEHLCFALVTRAVDFLLLASEPYNGCVPIRVELVEELRGIIKSLLTRYSAVLLSLFPVYQLQQRLGPLHAALDKYMPEDISDLVAELPTLNDEDFEDADDDDISTADAVLQIILQHKELVGKDGEPANFEGRTSQLERLKEATRILSEDGSLRWKKPEVFTSQEAIPNVVRSKLAISDAHASVWVAMSEDQVQPRSEVTDDEKPEATDDEESEATDDEELDNDKIDVEQDAGMFPTPLVHAMCQAKTSADKIS